jgi:hypothetical protein
MSKRLLFIGGVLNSACFLAYVILGYQITHLAQLAAPYRELMEALSVAGVLFVFFLAYSSFVHSKELLETALGRTALVLVSALYLSRAAEELFLFPFNPAIFGSCVLVGAIYVVLLVIAFQERSKPRLMRDEPRGLPRAA